MKIYSNSSIKGTQKAIAEINRYGETIYLSADMIGSLRDISLIADIEYDWMMCKLRKSYKDQYGRMVTVHYKIRDAKQRLNIN